jgi:hypothetical protein
LSNLSVRRTNVQADIAPLSRMTRNIKKLQNDNDNDTIHMY